MNPEVDRPASPEDFGQDDEDASPIVVGVNRSVAARAAASWAAVEARDRGIRVRLVAVIRNEHERGQAEDSMRCVRASVETVAPAVRVDEVIRFGEPSDVLVAESVGAAMVCVGTSHRVGASLEPTVATVAERAQCPVAVIRPEDSTGAAGTGVVAVVVDDEPGNDAVVAMAMQQGRRRNAVVRQIDHRLDSWVRRFPDVHVEIVADGAGWGSSRVRDRARPQLAVLPKTDAGRLVGSVSPCYHPIVGYPDVSMLFVPPARPSGHSRRVDGPVDDTAGPT
jgi:nucleotide-binding universal stress UspA family protein